MMKKLRNIGPAELSNYAFFVIGIVSLLLLPYTVSTYLAYAEDGYGVGVELSNFGLGTNNRGVQFTLTFDNPGYFDVEVINASFRFSDPESNTTHIVHYPGNGTLTLESLAVLERKSETRAYVQFISGPELYNTFQEQEWRLDATFYLYVQPRDAYLPLSFTYIRGGA